MAYGINGMEIARAHAHNPNFVATAQFKGYGVDKYLCECGAQQQIASTSKIGVWIDDASARVCPRSTLDARIALNLA
jgi:hypothetical protein